MKSSRRRRSGFMLMMVLVIIVLVSIVVAGFANHSLKVAVNSQASERNVQRKWAQASCQRVALELDSELLRVNPKPRNSPNEVGQLTNAFFEVELSGVTHKVVITDESAKADLNTLLEVLNEDRVTELAKSLISRSDVQLRFKELPKDSFERTAAIRRFQSWDQVFTDLEERPLSPEKLLEQANSLTLWGGLVNYRNSSDVVLREVSKAVAGPIVADRLLAVRIKSPDFSFEQALKSINPTEQQATRLGQVIGDQSEATGVWTISSEGNRQHYSLLVRRTFGRTINRYYSFSW